MATIRSFDPARRRRGLFLLQTVQISEGTLRASCSRSRALDRGGRRGHIFNDEVVKVDVHGTFTELGAFYLFLAGRRRCASRVPAAVGARTQPPTPTSRRASARRASQVCSLVTRRAASACWRRETVQAVEPRSVAIAGMRLGDRVIKVDGVFVGADGVTPWRCGTPRVPCGPSAGAPAALP